MGLGAKLSYKLGTLAGTYAVKLHGAYEYTRYQFSDFTDIRTDEPYVDPIVRFFNERAKRRR